MWLTRSWCLAQLTAVETIIFSSECLDKLLVVNYASGEKSHILRMIAAFVGGIILVIIPLLTLTANQLEKVMIALQAHDPFESHHLDDLSDADIHGNIIPMMKGGRARERGCSWCFKIPSLI